MVKLKILSIENSESYGLYASPTKLLKLFKDVIAPVISEMFNSSVKLRHIRPSKLKKNLILKIKKIENGNVELTSKLTGS